MKKLMIALAAAAAITGVAKATGVNHVTNFELLGNGAEFNATMAEDGTDNGDKYWAIETGATGPYAVVTNFEGGTGTYTKDSTRALSIDTDKLLSRKVNPNSDGAEAFTSEAPLYFDGYVQFTAADSLPETDEADKLVVWLYGGDESTDGDVLTGLGLTEQTKVATNLVVTAGVVDPESGDPTKTHFLIEGLTIAPNSWHRLTIKTVIEAVGDFSVPGFKVWVDENPVESTSGAKTFFSLVKHSVNGAKTLSSVSFKGTGAVDDLGFLDNDNAPSFAKDVVVETFTLTVTAATADLQGLVVSKDEESEIGINAEADGTYKVPMDLGTVYVYFPSIAEGTITSATFGNQAVEIPAYVGGYTFALTIPQGASGTTLGFAVTTSGGGSSDYPSYIDGIEDATTKAAYQTKYNAWKDTYGADAESSYQSQFLLNIAPNQKAELTTAAIVIENGAVKITTSPAAGSVNGKVYIKKATTVQGLDNTAWTEATVPASGDDVGKVTDTAGDAGFYQIKVDF